LVGRIDERDRFLADPQAGELGHDRMTQGLGRDPGAVRDVEHRAFVSGGRLMCHAAAQDGGRRMPAILSHGADWAESNLSSSTPTGEYSCSGAGMSCRSVNSE